MKSAIAFAFGLLLLPAAAQAQAAEELAALLDLFAPEIAYESLEPTPEGGVLVQGLTVSAAELRLMLQPSSMDRATEPDTAQVTGLTVGSLRLSQGATAMLIAGSALEYWPVEATAEDISLDLATLAGAAPFDQLAGHLQIDMLSGRFAVTVSEPLGGNYEIAIELELEELGVVVLDLDLDEDGVRLPAGEIWLTDTDARGLFGFGAWIRRGWMESALEIMEMFPIADSDRRAQETVAQLRAALASAPTTGPEAAGAFAEWAQGMAAALPEHAAVPQALADFGAEPGTLHITLAPSNPEGELAFDMSAGPYPWPTPEQLRGTIETLGISAEFSPAE